jgi:AcrR family transcriptional regulator
MEAVAREAGLVKPVLYNAFAGIAPLLDALLQREARRATDALAIALGPEPEHRAPDTTLRWWLDSLTRAIADDPAPWRLILLSPEETPPVVRDRVERGRAFALGRAQQLTVGFLEQRGLSGEVDAELLAHSLLAAAEHAANLLVRDPAAYPPERLMAFVDSLLGLTPS